jgi:rubrerythrin
MADKEKVIKELQRIADIINQYDDMLSVDDVDSWVILDALALLKDQEQKPKRFYGAWICPKCGFEVHRNWTNCHRCMAELNFEQGA